MLDAGEMHNVQDRQKGTFLCSLLCRGSPSSSHPLPGCGRILWHSLTPSTLAVRMQLSDRGKGRWPDNNPSQNKTKTKNKKDWHHRENANCHPTARKRQNCVLLRLQEHLQGQEDGAEHQQHICKAGSWGTEGDQKPPSGWSCITAAVAHLSEAGFNFKVRRRCLIFAVQGGDYWCCSKPWWHHLQSKNIDLHHPEASIHPPWKHPHGF